MAEGALHVRGVVLPAGEQRDLWITGGRLTYEPVRDAETVADGGWIVPGLVDCHCHIGMKPDGEATEQEMVEQAVTDRDAGALLIRDAGSPVDNRFVQDRADLPRLIRAGRHVARPKRYLRDVGVEVEPDGLVAAVEEQARLGDGWVKIVGDWIDRDLGDLAPLWPEDVAARAIARAHELGARVTAHVFGEQAAAELVGAGIDGIEHGTGLTDPVIALMAERQVALVPTMVQLENFGSIAASADAKFPRYAEHLRRLYAGRLEVFGRAFDAGVPIYAGTDAGGYLPHGLIGREIEELARFSSAEYALGAGSWSARSWLGRPGELVDGTPADLLVLDGDPRADLRVLRQPRHIVLRGRVVH
jgi:imidazolonepropionase-like amidohydrolase